MNTTDILDTFLRHIADMIWDILKRRGARRKALVDILLKRVQSKIMERDIEVQKMSLAMLVLEHKLEKNAHVLETIDLLKMERDQLRTEKQQWVKLKELYAKRLELLDNELAKCKENPAKSTLEGERES